MKDYEPCRNLGSRDKPAGCIAATSDLAMFAALVLLLVRAELFILPAAPLVASRPAARVPAEAHVAVPEF